MKLKDIKKFIEDHPEIDPETDVKVWIPGSRISLKNFMPGKGLILIEGNIDKDSVLYR